MKLTRKKRGKKILCNPPVAAAVESAERMMAEDMLTEGDVQILIECDETFCAGYNAVLKNAIERMRD